MASITPTQSKGHLCNDGLGLFAVTGAGVGELPGGGGVTYDMQPVPHFTPTPH